MTYLALYLLIGFITTYVFILDSGESTTQNYVFVILFWPFAILVVMIHSIFFEEDENNEREK